MKHRNEIINKVFNDGSTVVLTEGAYTTTYAFPTVMLETNEKKDEVFSTEIHELPFMGEFFTNLIAGYPVKMTATPGKNVTIVSVHANKEINNYIFDTFKI